MYIIGAAVLESDHATGLCKLSCMFKADQSRRSEMKTFSERINSV